MKSLLQFILESINSIELSKDLEFVKIEKEEAIKVLDENDAVKKLGFPDDTEYNDMLFFASCNHYEIKYKNYTLGVIGAKPINDFKYKDGYFSNSDIKKHEEKICFTISMKPLTNKYNDDQGKQEEIVNEVFYVVYLILFSDAKKEADINAIATIKVVFEKIKEMAKKENKKYIVAAGKDEKTSRLYCKCGGFKRYPLEEYKSEKTHYFDELIEQISINNVIYKL